MLRTRDALRALSNRDLAEMRRYDAPPAVVLDTLRAVMIILTGSDPVSWTTGDNPIKAQVVKGREFLERMIYYDSELTVLR